MEFFFPHKTGVSQILFFVTLQRLTSQFGNVTERVQAEAKSNLARLKCLYGKFCGIISVKYSGKCSSKTKLIWLFEETVYFVALQGAAQEGVALSAATSDCKIYLQHTYHFLRIRTLCQEV